jgi:hypothetical protein
MPAWQELERLRLRADIENKGADQVEATSFWHVQRVQV